ncbi:hypothetical protein L228DRAFT_165303 [Xylona heveae TC161]|uniref:Late endosomal/lysosomal adaptor and MAPK and MTOR activator-domain-containing protein n=1 Tax=Xylona heveae (strain CBS 132557 / TC161) TaxID=1328760 RepID=A0A165FJC0_XYLHT|nr:hypothetical protein L228DRAFT_165303 [Xylona heveae TC161]KZF21043.1 hypothetical protein L228DRAFT_165303 [Xylona heveae TC161]
MGNCSSCLGLGRSGSDAENPETSRLLYDDPYPPNYGGLNNGVPNGLSQADQQDIKREREALERVCLQTSDKLIDIFALQHQPADCDSAETKSDRYHRLIDKVLASQGHNNLSMAKAGESEEQHWLVAMAENPTTTTTTRGWRSVNGNEVGELLGTFSAPPRSKKVAKAIR